MSDREARIARNEALAREINEGIEEARASSDPEGYLRMVCECGNRECDRLLAVSIHEYEQVRSDPRRFLVVREHVVPDVEVVVAEFDRFVIVEKREGTPADVAEALDPRD
jgi:hypothetical protein